MKPLLKTESNKNLTNKTILIVGSDRAISSVSGPLIQAGAHVISETFPLGMGLSESRVDEIIGILSKLPQRPDVVFIDNPRMESFKGELEKNPVMKLAEFVRKDRTGDRTLILDFYEPVYRQSLVMQTQGIRTYNTMNTSYSRVPVILNGMFEVARTPGAGAA
jgi:hypothetical protein